MAGTIAVLNGVAGAGKTSIARAIQGAAREPYLNAGIDRFLGLLPSQYLEPPLWLDVMGLHDRPGTTGAGLVSSMHHAIAAIARSGMSVVADHVIVESRWLTDCAALFRDLPAYMVGVHCPIEVLRARERERLDRQATWGEVDIQFAIVHAHAAYDLEVDTTQMSPDAAARAILGHIEAYPPRAFPMLELFEGAPRFIRRLIAKPSAEAWATLLARAEREALEMPEPEQIELINSHPRIGAAPGSVSALSLREQGYDRDSGTAELQARLDRLNEAYEQRYGFRFVIFVAGRPRSEIAEIMERSLDADRQQEKQRALHDVIAIARDRVGKLGLTEEGG